MKKLCYWTSIVVALAFLCSCKPDYEKIATKNENHVKRRKAVEKISHTPLLADIALEDDDMAVRLAAIEKIQDQILLTEVAVKCAEKVPWMDEGADVAYEVGLAAVKKITDQALLEQVVIEAKEVSIRKRALDGLTDIQALKRVALRADDWELRRNAVMKLKEPSLLAEISTDSPHFNTRSTALSNLKDLGILGGPTRADQYGRLHAIGKFYKAFDSVPSKHKIRLLAGISYIIPVLIDPEVISTVGELGSVKASWHDPGPVKYGHLGLPEYEATGEVLTFSISLQKLSKPLTAQWRTEFPQEVTMVSFIAADVNGADLLGPIFDRLPPATVLRLAETTEAGKKAVTANKKRQDKLTAEALGAIDDQIRVSAIEQLNDLEVLRRLVQEGKKAAIRRAAQKRLEILLKKE